MENVIIKSLLGLGGGITSYCIYLHLISDKKISLLAGENKHLKEDVDSLKRRVDALEQDRANYNKQMLEIDKKLDRVLEYIPILKLFEKELSLVLKGGINGRKE